MAYLATDTSPAKGDLILALGSDSEEVGSYAARLFNDAFAPLIMFSGNRGRLTGCLSGTEASFLKAVALKNDVPDKAIVLEENSTNTLENIQFTRKKVLEEGITADRVILITQAVLQRRASATAQQWWPEATILNCPPHWESGFDVLENPEIVRLARLAVGEIDRLIFYAAKGNLPKQEIPTRIFDAHKAVNDALEVIGERGQLPMGLLSAARFAAEKHKDQLRKDNRTAYINHPIEVAELLARIGKVNDLPALQAALLHDTLEDCDTTAEEISEYFGAEVLSIVQELTDDKNLPKEDRKSLEIERAPKLSPRGKQIKLADKACNLKDTNLDQPVGWPVKRKLEYLDFANAVAAGCRGCNPALEQYFDEVLKKQKAVLEGHH